MTNNKLHPEKIPEEILLSKIYYLRDKKVMLDEDLAELYHVDTKRLNEQVRRNIERFPEDFMFQLTKEEFEILKSQFATSRWGGRRTMPYAFTEHGVLMLSSVLRSDKAIQVNIQIMRIFTKMKELMMTHKDLLIKLTELEQELLEQGGDIKVVFDYLNQFIADQETPREMIGFDLEANEK